MKNTGLLLSSNDYYSHNYKVINGWIVINVGLTTFNSTAIKRIIAIVNDIHRRYGNKNVPL